MLDLTKHQPNNPDCPICWMRGTRPCSCGGLLHNEVEYDDQPNEMEIIPAGLIFKCDKCLMED